MQKSGEMPRCEGGRIATNSKISGFSMVELLVVTAILTVILGITLTIQVRTSQAYQSQQELIDLQQNTRASLDMITRLIRMAGNNPRSMATTVVVPLNIDPDANCSGTPGPGNACFDSIWIRGDWNPADGDILDQYENISFGVTNGVLVIRQPGGVVGATPAGAAEEFAVGVQSLRFRFFDTENVELATPLASVGLIARIRVTLTSQLPNFVQSAPLVASSSATIRTRE